ncbi:MAG: TFIIB-type zinc finger domain-containing protein [Ruminococcus sp.]
MSFVCELCGCTNLVKTDGFFVCENCNTKYTLEEARKLMNGNSSPVYQESTNDVSLMTSDNALKLAREALTKKDYENSAKYYDIVLSEQASSWEAKFYSVYTRAITRPATETVNTSANLINNGVAVLELINDTVSDDNEKKKAVAEIANKLVQISTILLTNATNYFNSINREVRGLHKQNYLNNLVEAIKICYIIGDQIHRIFGNSYVKDFALPCWKTSSYQHQTYLRHIKLILGVDVYNNYKKKIQQWENTDTSQPEYNIF